MRTIRRSFKLCAKIGKVLQNLYCRDGLVTPHNHDFMSDARFRRAYARGVQAANQDYRMQWRVHIALWAASTAGRIEGDFVECGVNKGFVSSAIMTYLNWDRLGKTFYLLDTFGGLDTRYITEEEVGSGILTRNKDWLASGFYASDVEQVRDNFSEWEHVRIIQGAVPETLPEVDTSRLAFLHLDMNCSTPEVAAFEYFWDLLEIGGVILLDDYGFLGHESQKKVLDRAAAAQKASIAALPTGQGLLVKT